MDIERLVKNSVKDVENYKPGKPISEVKRELGLSDVYKMASNENPLGSSPKALKALKRELKCLNRYPDSGCFYLKDKLSKILEVRPENLTIGNGSDELIALTLRAFLNHSEEVIVAKPTFLMYELYSRIEGARVKVVPMKNFKYDLDAIRQAVTEKTKIIFIANPDNPCGTYVNRVEVERFLSCLPDNVIVFHDEAYYEFMDVEDYPQLISSINRRPLIISRTFSKVYGLAGLRIGYGIASPKITEYLNKARDPFNVNSLAQAAALAALDDGGFVKKSLELNKRGREYLFAELQRLGLEFVKSWTNCIVVKIGRNAADLVNYFLKNGIIIRNMSAWGLGEYIRVTVGLEKENRKFIRLLGNYLLNSEQ
ncbi:MAG: histidinol-phosphate transaminase [Candidatus Omnitrophica bacterium]|nr:histidinol-phosphate transaminase [Candidatus Omnitrophota bacterium]